MQIKNHSVESNIQTLETTISEMTVSIQQEFIKKITPLAKKEPQYSSCDNVLIGGCLFLSYLLNERLLALGYDSTMCGGWVTLGFSNSMFGVVEFGHPKSFDSVINHNGDKFDGISFNGHMWVEIPSLDVVIDLTLLNLQEKIDHDNYCRDLPNEIGLLDNTKVVIRKQEQNTRAEIISGTIGYSYKKDHLVEALGRRKLANLMMDVKSNEK